MEKDYKFLIDRMNALKKNYLALNGVVEQLNAEIDAGAETRHLISLFAERNEVFDMIKSIDADISTVAQKPGNEKLLESKEPAALLEQLQTIVKGVMEEDETLRVKMENEQDAVRKELGSLSNSLKSVSGYAKTKKPVYAKFIDIKH